MKFHADFDSGGEFTAAFYSEQNMQADFGAMQEVTTSDYEGLTNKPQINGETLIGNKSEAELGIERLTNSEIEEIINIFV